jgi:DNA-binding transcriptional MerR regulator
MAGWTARELARQTGVPAATLASWITGGIITPEHYGRGRGGHVVGVSGLLELLSVLELRQAGFSLQAIRRTVENLRELTGHARPLVRLILVVCGRDIAWKDAHELSDITISALQRPGQRLMVFPIGERYAELLHQLGTPNPSHNLGELGVARDTSSHVP